MTQTRPAVGGIAYRPRTSVNTSSHAAGCACPVCAGLQTFVRPRFFAGQLLTDSELTALTSYVVDKQRLHNVHLHGWGVVCGLQVECDGCGPGVLVRPGYAIDPCGYDIVVPAASGVDVLGLIQQCQTASTRLDCDPPRLPSATGCPDEQTWCLYVRYLEQDARPVTALGGTASASAGCGCGGNCGGSSASTATGSGGCGCGGSPARKGWECTCGGGGSRNAACGCVSAGSATTSTSDCQPSRTYESYELGVCHSDESCGDLGARLDGTFPVKVWECIKHIQPVLSKGMTKQMQGHSASLLLGGSVSSGNASSAAVCQLYRNVLELYRTDPMRAQCVLPEQLADIDCSPQEADETDAHYHQRLVNALQSLVVLVLLYLRDCVCHNLLPPCPDGVCDDRVILACLTVKDGAVASICNFDCRRYAGSFVSRDYWLPIGPVLSWLAGLICCFPLVNIRPKYGFGDRTHLAAFAAGRRYSAISEAVRRDDFALVKMWRTRLADLAVRFRPSTLLDRAEDVAAAGNREYALSRYVGQPVDVAVASLGKQDIEVRTSEVEYAWQAPVGPVIPTARPGSVVRLYVHQGRVVAVEPGVRRTATKAAPAAKATPARARARATSATAKTTPENTAADKATAEKTTAEKTTRRGR